MKILPKSRTWEEGLVLYCVMHKTLPLTVFNQLQCIKQWAYQKGGFISVKEVHTVRTEVDGS